MPFSDGFNDVYELGIKDVCKAAGAYCERVDEQIFQGSMLDRIYNQIAKADFVIADMTGQNPNVFYEVGYANALGKRTILLTQDAGDIPFDLKHYPHVVYGKKITELKDVLKRHVKWCIDNPESSDADQKIDVEVFHGSSNLSSEVTVVKSIARGELWQDFTLHNSGAKHLGFGDCKVGILTHPFLDRIVEPRDSESVILPDKTMLHMLPPLETLFPGEFTSFGLRIFVVDNFVGPIPFEIPATIRIFTPAGYRDYPFTAQFGLKN
ncbi:MAG: hypothetical protein ACI8P0_006190 [Planctomycetaceae bacterium]|jgi:hypothetical protein